MLKIDIVSRNKRENKTKKHVPMFVCVLHAKPANCVLNTCSQTDFEIEVTDKGQMYSSISFGNFKPVLLYSLQL